MNHNKNFKFVIQSTAIDSDRPIVRRDKDGFYTMPGFVFDAVSRNGKLYDTAHMIDCLTNPQHRFYRMLLEGTLHGEYGHPITEDFSRLTKIKERNYAIFIKKIEAGQLPDGSRVTYVTFKPVGRYGKYFAEALEDKDRNAALSIRAACKEGPITSTHQILYPKTLITFDAVGGGGFMEACKRYALSQGDEILSHEDYETSFTEADLINNTSVFMEDISSNALLEHFRADKITTTTRIITPTYYTEAQKADGFHRLFRV